MGPIWGRQDPGGPHVGPMNFAIWDINVFYVSQDNTAIMSSVSNHRSKIIDIVIDYNSSKTRIYSKSYLTKMTQNSCNQ